MRRCSALLASGALLLASGLALTGVHAASALLPVPQAGDGLLRLEASAQPAWFEGIAAGETRYLRIAVHLDDASAGTASLELRKDGELVEHGAGLELRLQHCERAWSAVPQHGALDAAPSCDGAAREIAAAGPAHDYRSSSPVWPLGELRRGRTQELLLSLHLPASGGDRSRLEGRFAVGLHAEGADLDTLGQGVGGGAANAGTASFPAAAALPALGAAPLPAIALAAGLLLLGLGLRRRESAP